MEVLLLLCHISATFDNRKGSRITTTARGDWSRNGFKQFLLSRRKKLSFRHGPPGHLPVETTARSNLRLAGVL